MSNTDFHGFYATKRRYIEETIVSSSVLPSVPVGSPLKSLNNIETSTMSPREVEMMFNSRMERIIPEIFKTDLEHHGFTVTKIKKSSGTFVLQSILPNIEVGAVVISIDGVLTSSMTPSVLKRLFSFRNSILRPILADQVAITTDLEFHGFIADKDHTVRRSLVVESTNASIQVGAEVISLNGVELHNVIPSQLKRMFSSRSARLIPILKPELSDIDYDAKTYSEMMSETAMFCICALCGEEGPPKGSVTVSDCKEYLDKTNIQQLYDDYTNCLSESENHKSDELGYAKEIRYYLPNGLLRGEKKICRVCFNKLSKLKKLEESSAIGTDLNTVSDKCRTSLPSDALILGLFPGQIPIELSDLNPIEVSMISIYSSISKVSLHGGKNYSANGALTYTIVNDITSVARKLPRMPTVDSIAILRYGSGKNCKDYKYRPFFVKRALNWLVAYNHLYSTIDIEWPDNIDWNDTANIRDAPLLPLSENDVRGLEAEESSGAHCEEQQQTSGDTILVTCIK